MTSQAVAVSSGIVLALLTGCSSSAPARPSVAQLAKAYLAIAEPANRVLDRSFDALEDDQNPQAAAKVLHTIATTERGFDRDLLALKLPSPVSEIAVAMVKANEARADLTTQAMAATNRAALGRYKVELAVMNGPVEVQVRALRHQLHLPPPDTD